MMSPEAVHRCQARTPHPWRAMAVEMLDLVVVGATAREMVKQVEVASMEAEREA